MLSKGYTEMKYVVATQAECREIQVAESAARGYPLRGTHVGPGYHAPISEDPKKDSQGWVFEYRSVMEDKKDRYAYEIEDPVALMRLLDGNVSEQAIARIQASKELPKDWDPKESVGADLASHPVQDLERNPKIGFLL